MSGSVSGVNSNRTSPMSLTNSSKTLGKDEFLKILITQLKHQDPMQPMQDREFIAQMAQFSSLEQMMNMGSEMKLLRQSLGQTSSLIGKEMTWTIYNESGVPNGVKSGVVEAIVIRDGIQLAKVGAENIDLANVVEVRANAKEQTS